MSTDNRTLIEKADLALSDLQSDGGYLTDQQLDKFIRLAIKSSVLLKDILITPMKGPRDERDKIRFAGRVLQPGDTAVALPLDRRSTPDLSKYVLDAQLFRGEVRLSDEVLEDQIERGSFQETVAQLMAAAVARDIEFVAIQGDTTSANPLLAKLDGFLVQATANLVNAGASNLTKEILKDMLKALPDEFAATEALRYYTNRQARVDYQDSLQNRATEMGDRMFMQTDRVENQGIPVQWIPEWPNGVETFVLLTDPKNLVVGFHRKVRFERDRDRAAGTNLILATVRFDAKIQEVTATSKATDVATT
jgi:hypothetical protein